MKNKAISLAEVLIALGIIGVVSSLTMPSLMKASQHAATGAQLAKIMIAVEEAAGRVVLEFQEVTLKELDEEGKFNSEMEEQLIGGKKLKDGTVISYSDGSGTVPAAAGTAFKDIHVDLNGDTGPNSTGIDKFWFTMSTQGLVFPQECAKVLQDNNWKMPKDYNPPTCPEG